MPTLHDKHRSFLRRFLAFPLVCSLASASLLVGYASGSLMPGFQASASRRISAALDTASDDLPALSGPADPLAEYRAAMSLLQGRYAGPIVTGEKARTLTYEAIRGMLESLNDPFTSFLDPGEWAQMQSTTRGDFEGIGALLQEDPDTKVVRIVEPIETSPAERAGVKAGDVVNRVNGRNVAGLDINSVVNLIKGPRGTKVTLEVRRGSIPFTFSLVRSRVEPPVVKHWMADEREKIGRILLKEFNEKSMDQLGHALTDLKRRGARAIILDLRNNPGGLLETAIEVASVFVPRDRKDGLNNAAVLIQEGGAEAKTRFLRGGAYRLGQMPLVVLANSGSASASEIVTGAIKDHGVGTIVGERTYGKGKVQTLFPLDDGSALRLTTALYFPPRRYDINFRHDADGRRIPGTGGILPDFEVKQRAGWRDSSDDRDDAQLQKALEILRASLHGEPASGTPVG